MWFSFSYITTYYLAMPVEVNVGSKLEFVAGNKTKSTWQEYAFYKQVYNFPIQRRNPWFFSTFIYIWITSLKPFYLIHMRIHNVWESLFYTLQLLQVVSTRNWHVLNGFYFYFFYWKVFIFVCHIYIYIVEWKLQCHIFHLSFFSVFFLFVRCKRGLMSPNLAICTIK